MAKVDPFIVLRTKTSRLHFKSDNHFVEWSYQAIFCKQVAQALFSS